MLNLNSVVPDEPISVPDGANWGVKWISNYDGQFKGMIPARMALAESRNAVAIWITGGTVFVELPAPRFGEDARIAISDRPPFCLKGTRSNSGTGFTMSSE